MRNTLWGCIAAAMLFLSLTARLNAGALEVIAERGVLRLAICQEDFPPFSFRDGGEWKGCDIDLAAALANELNVHLTVVTHPDWEGVIDMVRDGKAEIGMSSLSISPKRSRKVAFSLPYMYLKQGVLMNQLSLLAVPGDDNLAKLNSSEATVAVRHGSIYRQLLPKYLPRAKITEYATWDECYQAARDGVVTGVIGDEAQLLNWLGRVKGDSMRLIPMVFQDKHDPIAIAMPQGDTAFHAFVNAFLQANPQNANMSELYWRYKTDNGDEEEIVMDGTMAGEMPVFIFSLVISLGLAVYLFCSARR